MTKKRIISLICALSMIFSLFTVVNAADKKGIGLDANLSEDGKTITVTAKAQNTVDAIANFAVVFAVPEGVTDDDIEATSPAGDLITNIADGVLYVAYNNTNPKKPFIPADNLLATVKIALASPLSADYTITLAEDAGLQDSEGAIKVKKGTMDATTVTVEKWVDPSAPTPKPTSPARPTIAPVPTENPDVTAAPTDVPTVGKGIALSSSISDDNKTITVTAKAQNTVDAIANFAVVFAVPEGVTDDAIEATSPAGDLITNIADGVLYVAYNNTNPKKPFIPADNLLATIKITLPTALTAPYAITLAEDAGLQDSEGAIKVKKGTMTAASTVVTPSTEPVPTVNPVKTVELKSVVSTGYGDAIKAAKDAGKDVYLTVDVKKGDQDAVYGEDYEAVYNGKTLTEAEYKNLISGYTDADMADVINGLTYNIYNSSVNKVSTTVNSIDTEGNAEQIVDPKDNTLTPATPTAKPSEPSISVKASSTIVEFDKKFTVTATVKNAKDGAKVAFTTSDEKYAAIFGTPTEINSKGETKATYVANDKAGTVTITATYTDTEGNEKSASVKVTVKKASTTTGGNDGTTSGGGPGIIAPGNVGTVTTPNTDSNYKPDFQDLDSVEWARTAINGLAMRGMINGRDQYTFDPNANITRAEYCQILMGAINALNAKGESTFADVPSTAWYYNAVSVASQLGIVSGYGDGNFGPNDLITRQDMALMTYKTAQIMNKSLEPVNAEITFEDSHEIADYAFEAVMTLQKAGIINGMTDTTFEPLSNATRAQSAKVIFDTFVDAQ